MRNAASTQTRRTISFHSSRVLRLGTGGLGTGNRLGDCHATDRRPHPSCTARISAGLHGYDVWLRRRADPLGKAWKAARIPGCLDSTPVPAESSLRAYAHSRVIPDRG